MHRMTGMVVLAAAALVTGAWMAQAPAPQVAMVAVTFTTGPAWAADRQPGDQPGFREHSANLVRLRKEGRIVAGGRYGRYGLIIVQAETEQAARDLFRDDPAIAAGTFRAEFNAWRTIYSGTIP